MVEETRVHLCLFGIDCSLVEKAPVLAVDFAYHIEDVRSIARRPDHCRVVEIVSLLELCLHRRQKSGCEVDKLSPQALDCYKLDDTRSIVYSNHSQVTLVNHNPIELLLCYQSSSIFEEVLG